MPALAVAAVGIAAGAAVSAALTTGIVIGGTTLVAGLGFSAFTGMIVGGLVGTVVSMGLSAAFGLGAAPKLRATAADRKQLIKSSVAPWQAVYGRARISGNLIYAASSGPDMEHLHVVVVLACHRITAVDRVWINDVEIPASDIGGDGMVTGGKLAGLARIRVHLGDQTAADPELMAESPDGWGGADKLLGRAYIYARLTYNRDAYPNSFQGLSAEVRGKPVLDPRTGVTAYSANWALCLLDYMSWEHGMDCAGDELDADSFIAAANLSDEFVQLDAEGTKFQPRYEVGGAFSLDREPQAIIDDMMTAACGAMPYVQGKFRLAGGAYEIPTVTLTPEHFDGEIQLATKPPRRELFNAVRGTFLDPARDWQASEFPEWVDAGLVAQDGEKIYRDVELPWTNDATAAQRLAKQILRRGRETLSFSVPLRYRCLELTVWQVVGVTVPDLGWSNKPFRITNFSIDPVTGKISGAFKEEGPGSYGWLYDEAALIPPMPDTTLIDPLTLPMPQDVVMQPTTAVDADGTTVAALEVSWTRARHAFVQAHEVQWRPSGALAWFAVDVPLPSTRHLIRPVIAGQVMEVRVRAVAALVRGPWSAVTVGTGEPDTTPPATPSALEAVGVVRGVGLRWVNPADRDLARIEVWERAAAPGSVSAKVGETAGDSFLRTGFAPAEQAWFKVRAVDRSGNKSSFTAEVLGKASLVVASDLEQRILTTASFAEGLAPVELFESALPGTGNFEGRLVLLKSTSKLYRFVNGAWTSWVDGQDLGDGTIPFGKLSAGAVRANEIFGESIKARHLAASEEIISTAAQFRTAVIDEAAIGTLSVSTLKLKNGAVTSAWSAYWSAAANGGTPYVQVAAGDDLFGGTMVALVELTGTGLPWATGDEQGNIVVPRALASLRRGGTLLRQVECTFPQTLFHWSQQVSAAVQSFTVDVTTQDGAVISELLLTVQLYKR